MRLCDYDDIERHTEAHRSLVAQVNGYMKTWQSTRQSDVLDDLKVFLRKWLVEHIMRQDLKIAAWCVGKEHEIEKALSKL